MGTGDKARVRRFAPKTRTGCLTCKRRRVKCDERKPTCYTCERVSAKCEGYQTPKTWVFDGGGTGSSPYQASAPWLTINEALPVGSSHSPQDIISQADLDPVTRRKLAILQAGYTNPLVSLRLFKTLPSGTGEPAVLMQDYVTQASNCPMSWDTALFLAPRNSEIFTVDDTGALISPQNKRDGIGPGLLEYRSYIALAAATLHLFWPQKYPPQVFLKYLHNSVVEIRRQITQGAYSIEDLLHGITKTLLASVLLGDEESAKAHFTAVASLVEQQGGIDQVDTQIAALLRYADFHFAVEHLSAPAFPILIDLDDSLERDLSKVDQQLVTLGQKLKKQAKNSSTISPMIALAFHRLVNSVIALAHAYATSTKPTVDFLQLNWVASNVCETFYLILGGRTSSMEASAPLLTPPNPSARDLDLNDHTAIMVLWLQVLLCCANETLMNPSLRYSVLTVQCGSSPASESWFSDRVRDGMTKWNAVVKAARDAHPADSDDRNWPQLVHVPADMEQEQEVKVAPFMYRFLAIRHKRADSVSTDEVKTVSESGSV
jgi:hypothetical protein